MANALERGEDVPYGYRKQLEMSHSDALVKVKEELMKEGFGILAEMNMKATLKKKLNIDIDDYIILGACNPPIANKALTLERDIGLLLPCNVVVYGYEGKNYVAVIRPTVAMSIVQPEELKAIAVQMEKKLKSALDNI